ncbi:DUF6602 domain-containing protein, partial [Nitrososphaera sp.]|uniref:DUF6602 domain-containing protein n=1 Tax=Nitrososphaera sp. TaxID=1971748 RepID=UPI002ED7966E
SRHIPLRCGVVKGGFVFDSEGNESKQIDIIITNDGTLQFQNEITSGKSFNSIDGCAAVITVKSFLDKDALIDCMDNLASLPPLKNLAMSGQVENPKEMVQQLPQRIIFAYRGLGSKTIYDHMREYAKERKLADIQLPGLVIVNNSHYIEVIGQRGVPLITGEIIRNQVRRWEKNNPYFGGLMLFRMLVRIQHISTLSPHIILDWEPYLAGLARAAENHSET